jgi:hypothetical protein
MNCLEKITEFDGIQIKMHVYNIDLFADSYYSYENLSYLKKVDLTIFDLQLSPYKTHEGKFNFEVKNLSIITKKII